MKFLCTKECFVFGRRWRPPAPGIPEKDYILETEKENDVPANCFQKWSKAASETVKKKTARPDAKPIPFSKLKTGGEAMPILK